MALCLPSTSLSLEFFKKIKSQADTAISDADINIHLVVVSLVLNNNKKRYGTLKGHPL